MLVFEMLCGALIAFVFGMTLCFAGYRFFLVLLPIWGFVFGIGLGVQTMQALFGTGFLAEVTSWVIGFIVGVVFAVLSYLFYIIAVAIVAGSLGYIVTVGLLEAIGMNMGFLLWLIGIVVAIVLAFVTLRFNLQKVVIIVATALLGAGVVYGGFYVLFNPVTSQLLESPIKAFLAASPLLMILAIATAVFGMVVQFKNSRNFTLESYNHWE